MRIITLITDFGLKDGNVGVMKGIIWNIAPHVHIADLSHLIAPQNIPEAALILLRSAPYFPAGSIHLVVVDPGVGTARRPLAARLGEQFFVGPDNGVMSYWLARIEREEQPCTFVHLDRPEYWLPEVSHVFHGRDIFAPVAAHLASGVALDALGTRITDPIRLELPRPQPIENGFLGEIIHIDHFGNLATNIFQEHMHGRRVVSVSLRGQRIRNFVRTFAERAAGELVTLFGSTGSLIISEVNGNAAMRLGAQVGDGVEVEVASEG